MTKKKAAKKRKVSSLRRETAQKSRQMAFLEAYKLCATIIHAARATNIGRQTHYDWLEKDEKYQAAFAEAEVAASEALIAEARRRAIQGTEKPAYHKGKVVGTIREYSDTLLIFLMKGDNPEKYRDHHHISGDVNLGLVMKKLMEGRARLAKHRESETPLKSGPLGKNGNRTLRTP